MSAARRKEIEDLIIVPEGMTQVFVYGTLLSGMPNHRLLATSKMVASNAFLYGKLVSLGGFPGLLNAGLEDNMVYGEVYHVDAETLANLDRLEGYSVDREPKNNMYNRITINAFAETKGGELITLHDVNVYEYNHGRYKDSTYPVIEHGSWKRFIKKGSKDNGTETNRTTW